MTAPDWTEHPLLLALSPRQRNDVIVLVAQPHSNIDIGVLAGVDAELVQQVRRARRSWRDRQRDHRRRETPRPKPAWVPLTKPCPCEREGCMVVQRVAQSPSEFRGQKFASGACSNYARRKEPTPVEVKVAPPPPPPKLQPIVPGPETFVAILARRHPRGEGEPTRETVHSWASSHSGKRELSTQQVAALRAPTVVCTVSMLEALA